MSTLKRFEDLEIWQLARDQSRAFFQLSKASYLNRDFELRKQMNASSGSVMDCIAEGFERSGNKEFSQFLLIAKGSNGEFRSQLYRCLDRQYLNEELLEKLILANQKLGNKLMAFASYLRNSEFKGQRYKF